MSKKFKLIILLFMGSFVTVLIGICWHFQQKNERSTDSTQELSNMKQQFNSSVAVKEVFRQRARGVSPSLPLVQVPPVEVAYDDIVEGDLADSPEQDLADVPQMTHEEIEQAKQWQKIADVFFSERGAEAIQEMLEEETQDSGWTAEVSAFAEEILSAEKYLESTLEEVDCREALCKVAIRHENELEFEMFKQQDGFAGPWMGEQYGHGVDLEGNAKRTLIFFGRQDVEQSPFQEFKNRLEKEVDDSTES